MCVQSEHKKESSWLSVIYIGVPPPLNVCVSLSFLIYSKTPLTAPLSAVKKTPGYSACFR